MCWLVRLDRFERELVAKRIHPSLDHKTRFSICCSQSIRSSLVDERLMDNDDSRSYAAYWTSQSLVSLVLSCSETSRKAVEIGSRVNLSQLMIQFQAGKNLFR